MSSRKSCSAAADTASRPFPVACCDPSGHLRNPAPYVHVGKLMTARSPADGQLQCAESFCRLETVGSDIL